MNVYIVCQIIPREAPKAGPARIAAAYLDYKKAKARLQREAEAYGMDGPDTRTCTEPPWEAPDPTDPLNSDPVVYWMGVHSYSGRYASSTCFYSIQRVQVEDFTALAALGAQAE